MSYEHSIYVSHMAVCNTYFKKESLKYICQQIFFLCIGIIIIFEFVCCLFVST